MKTKNISIRSSAAEILTYICDNGKNSNKAFEIWYEDENIWLTQRMMAELYGVDIADINHQIKKIFDDNELSESSTIKKYLIVQKEGNREISRNINHYNLQTIIAVNWPHKVGVMNPNFGTFLTYECSSELKRTDVFLHIPRKDIRRHNTIICLLFHRYLL